MNQPGQKQGKKKSKNKNDKQKQKQQTRKTPAVPFANFVQNPNFNAKLNAWPSESPFQEAIASKSESGASVNSVSAEIYQPARQPLIQHPHEIQNVNRVYFFPAHCFRFNFLNFNLDSVFIHFDVWNCVIL